ncbi:hypothetical protein [Nocardiopsis tropica]|uniref:Uncharacterized protein n=1 Tax=Nocardiopsis tropica TaxID=109330 RepID=A0ABU7KP40_9ACTN|nr:hypothetical protein [Nocardiopsis umidischolae]MEE2051050.1 hypothetical protein [Nocardiopsis umidischolae]
MEEMTQARRSVGWLVVSTSTSLVTLCLCTPALEAHWAVWPMWAVWVVLAAVTVWSVVTVRRIGRPEERRRPLPGESEGRGTEDLHALG